jgi:serine/threonine protein kinase
MLGQGSFGKVFRVRRLDGHEYAVKRTLREVSWESQEFLQFMQVLAHVPPHPGIVRCHSAWTESGVDGGERLFTQLELCSGALGAHQALLGEALVEKDLVEIARQIAAALAHLHDHGVARLDVKPSNIYISLQRDEFRTGGGTGSTRPPDTRFELGDFGQAMRLDGISEQDACVNEGDSRYLPLEVTNASCRT